MRRRGNSAVTIAMPHKISVQSEEESGRARKASLRLPKRPRWAKRTRGWGNGDMEGPYILNISDPGSAVISFL